MKKYFGALMISTLILSVSLATAQVSVNGGSVSVNGSVGGTAVGVGVGVGTTNGTAVGGTRTVGGGVIQGQNVARQQNTADLSFIQTLLAQIGGIVRMLPPILTGFAVVAFFWFLIKYLILDKNEPAARATATKGLMFSLLAIFIMVALWGILAFFGDAIGVNSNVTVQAVQLPQ
ncbi:MAG: hypothetical protein WCO35_02035 [Candidatus Nomurabacteria bacterium]